VIGASRWPVVPRASAALCLSGRSLSAYFAVQLTHTCAWPTTRSVEITIVRLHETLPRRGLEMIWYYSLGRTSKADVARLQPQVAPTINNSAENVQSSKGLRLHR